MSGLFGGGDDTPAAAPAPTRSPKGVKIVKMSGGPSDSILARGLANTLSNPGGVTLMDDDRTGVLGRYGGDSSGRL